MGVVCLIPWGILHIDLVSVVFSLIENFRVPNTGHWIMQQSRGHELFNKTLLLKKL